MNHEKSGREKASGVVYIVARVMALLGVCSMFFSSFNPAYIFTRVGGSSIVNSTSVFTGAVSSNSIMTSVIRAAVDKGSIDGGPFTTLRLACILIVIGLVAAGAAGCTSVGNVRLKHLANKIFMAAGAILIGGCCLIFSFHSGVEGMIHEKEHEGAAYSATLAQQTDKMTFTLGGKTLTKDDIPDEIVYKVTIKNETGKEMTGWAIELTVGEGYSADKVLKFNKWASLVNKVEPDYHYNVEVQGDKLVITPDNFVLTEEGLVQKGESISPEAANMPAGEIVLTLIAEDISAETEIIVTDGASVAQNEWQFPVAAVIYLVIGIIMLLTGLINDFVVEKTPAGTRYEMETKYSLFIMFIPFLLLIFAFSYLPLYGWRYAFFEENTTFQASEFVGFKWFSTLFESPALRSRFFRVMTNTLAMSGLGLLTSWMPMAFAIFLNEIKNTKFRRFIQTFSTIPNFISWVLVYAIAFSIFATDGFINNLMGTKIGFLTDDSFLWIKMLLWGTWKGVGWSAIIYISGISGIDQQLYEAASIDGADRFQKMWNITLPGLMPTYVVMLVMSIAGILSNGMDQYLVFSNAATEVPLEVLDLYTYKLGIGSGQVALSTVVGMGKSIISIVLFFVANTAAKKIRGNGIV